MIWFLIIPVALYVSLVASCIYITRNDPKVLHKNKTVREIFGWFFIIPILIGYVIVMGILDYIRNIKFIKNFKWK